MRDDNLHNGSSTCLFWHTVVEKLSADETGNRIRTLEDAQNFIKTLSCRLAAVAIVLQNLSFLWGQNSPPTSVGKTFGKFDGVQRK